MTNLSTYFQSNNFKILIKIPQKKNCLLGTSLLKFFFVMATSKISNLANIIEKCLLDEEIFLNFTQHLCQNTIIDFRNLECLKAKYFQSKEGRKIAVEKAFEVLRHYDPCKITNIFGSSVCTNAWNRHVKQIKEYKKKNYAYISLSSYFPIKIKMSNIQASINISTENQINNFTENLESYNYSNFHKVFNKEFKKIVIRGESGIGKTVQFKYLTHLWANDEWDNLNEICVLNLTIRDVKPEEDLFDAIFRENFHETAQFSKNLLKILMEVCKDNFILLIDGADELNNDHRSFKDIIKEPFIKTVIWTRNLELEDITCDLLFELKGFNKVQLERFLLECSSKEGQVEQFLKNIELTGHQIKNMCRIPLLALNIFFLFVESKKKIFVKSRYELYSEIVKLTIQSKEITEPIFMNEIMKVSFLQLSSRKIVFHSEQSEIQAIKEIFLKIIKTVQQSIKNKEKYEIEFYHSSFREYFAAEYILKKGEKFNFQNKFERYFSKLPSIHIFGMMEFVEDFSETFFIKILLGCSSMKNIYNLENSWIEYLKCPDSIKKLDFTSKELTDKIVFRSILKSQKLLKEINLTSTMVDHLSYLSIINKHCNQLQILRIRLSRNDVNDDNFLSEVLDLLDKMIERKQMRIIKINDVNVEMSDNSIHLETEENVKLLFAFKQNTLRTYKLTNYKETIKSSDVYSIIMYILGNTLEIQSVVINSSTKLKFLKDNHEVTFTSLTLQKLMISKIEWDIISKVLMKNNILMELVLKDCFIHKLLFEEISLAFKNLKKLRNFQVSYNNVRPYGSKYSNAEPIENDLQRCFSISETDLKSNRNWNSGYNTMFNELFAYKDYLRKVSFRNCGLNERNMSEIEKSLQHFNSLIELDFGRNKHLGSRCVKILKELSRCKYTLQKISFYRCGLNKQNVRGIEYTLHEFTSLNEIDFGWNENLGSGCIKILDGLHRSKNFLEKINFSKCGLNEKNMESIKDALEPFTCIKEIDFEWNEDLGSGCLKILNGLLNCKNDLEKINFSKCSLNKQNIKGVEHVLLQFTSISHIDFKWNENFGSGCIEVLSGLLTSKKLLKKISFNKCGLNVQNIDKIDDVLNEFTSITEVDFGCNESLGLMCISILKGLINSKQRLKKISFSNCGLQEQFSESIKAVLLHFAFINEIDFGWNGNLGLGCVKLLKGLEKCSNHLKRVSFNNCGLDNRKIKGIANALKQFTSVNEINVRCNEILGSGCIKVLHGLRNCKNVLGKITFSKCGLDEKGLESIENVLKEFRTISEADFGWNENIRSGCLRLLDGLEGSKTTLRNITFVDCGLDNQNIKGIGRHLQQFSSLNSIHFGWNEKLGSGCKEILSGLSRCRESLQTIYFESCGINTEDLTEYEDILRKFTALQEERFDENLDLECLNISSELVGYTNTQKKASFSKYNLDEKTIERIQNFFKEFNALNEIEFEIKEDGGNEYISMFDGQMELSACNIRLSDILKIRLFQMEDNNKVYADFSKFQDQQQKRKFQENFYRNKCVEGILSETHLNQHLLEELKLKEIFKAVGAINNSLKLYKNNDKCENFTKKTSNKHNTDEIIPNYTLQRKEANYSFLSENNQFMVKNYKIYNSDKIISQSKNIFSKIFSISTFNIKFYLFKNVGVENISLLNYPKQNLLFLSLFYKEKYQTDNSSFGFLVFPNNTNQLSCKKLSENKNVIISKYYNYLLITNEITNLSSFFPKSSDMTFLFCLCVKNFCQKNMEITVLFIRDTEINKYHDIIYIKPISIQDSSHNFFSICLLGNDDYEFGKVCLAAVSNGVSFVKSQKIARQKTLRLRISYPDQNIEETITINDNNAYAVTYFKREDTILEIENAKLILTKDCLDKNQVISIRKKIDYTYNEKDKVMEITNLVDCKPDGCKLNEPIKLVITTVLVHENNSSIMDYNGKIKESKVEKREVILWIKSFSAHGIIEKWEKKGCLEFFLDFQFKYTYYDGERATEMKFCCYVNFTNN